LLAGDGSQVRYARFRRVEDIQPASLTPLIVQALEVAALTKNQKQQILLERDARLDGLKRA
jgi:hypothetical protein